MARVSQEANGDVVLRMAPLEIKCLEALSIEGADACFEDAVTAHELFKTGDNLKVAKGVFRAIMRARRLVAAN